MLALSPIIDSNQGGSLLRCVSEEAVKAVQQLK
jgi:hypothetical protein